MSTTELQEIHNYFDEEIRRRKREEKSPERPPKRLKVTEESEAEETTDKAGHPEVWRLVAHSGFLRSQDLGKLLLLSSKSILTKLTPQFVYSILYESRLTDRWASPSKGAKDWVPASVVRARGHESILKSMESSPVLKNRISALPFIPKTKSTLHPQNTVMIVSFWILTQKIYSRQLSRDEITRFAKTGRVDLKAKKSLYQIANLCFQKNSAFPQKLRNIQTKNDCDNVHSNIGNETAGSLVVAKIHCIRLDTNQTCILYHSNFPRFEMQRTRAESGQIRFPIQRALKNTQFGEKLVAQWFHGWPEGIQNFGGLTFGITLNQGGIHLESIVFGQPGQSKYLQSRHGVTAFHLLEGLDGWR
jgi:hypothetical protein